MAKLNRKLPIEETERFDEMRILAFDLGTANIGLCIFSEHGVLLNSITISYNDIVDRENQTKCSVRRQKRSQRRQYDHNRRRKVRLLFFLAKMGFIHIDRESLKLWRNEQKAPEELLKEISIKNPYAVRERLTFNK